MTRFHIILAWLLISLGFSLGIACADDQSLLQYVAGVAKKSGDDISTLREEVAMVKAVEESNTWLLRLIAGGLLTGAIGLGWQKLKGKE